MRGGSGEGEGEVEGVMGGAVEHEPEEDAGREEEEACEGAAEEGAGVRRHISGKKPKGSGASNGSG